MQNDRVHYFYTICSLQVKTTTSNMIYNTASHQWDANLHIKWVRMIHIHISIYMRLNAHHNPRSLVHSFFFCFPIYLTLVKACDVNSRWCSSWKGDVWFKSIRRGIFFYFSVRETHKLISATLCWYNIVYAMMNEFEICSIYTFMYSRAIIL